MSSNLLSGIINPTDAGSLPQRFAGIRQEAKQQETGRISSELAGKVLSETLSSKLGKEAFAKLQRINPNAAISMRKELGLQSQQDQEMLIGATKGAAEIINKGGTAEDVAQWMSSQALIMEEMGSQGLSQRFVDAARAIKNPETQQETIRNLLLTDAAFGGGDEKDKGIPAEQAAFEALIADFSPADQKAARRRKAGLDARAVGSAGQTIAEEGTAENVAAVEERLAKAKETGKLKGQLILAPQIAKAVTIARKKAEAQGDAFTDLARSQAALPGLKDTVAQLKDLALIATSTMSGRVFDTVRKEIGFGPSKGKTARTKFIAIINNQVLPLLKQTFGGAFSVQEGESLKATMGDPDTSPEEKLAQLDAFIAQKERDLTAKGKELSSFGGDPADLNSLSDDALLDF